MGFSNGVCALFGALDKLEHGLVEVELVAGDGLWPWTEQRVLSTSVENIQKCN